MTPRASWDILNKVQKNNKAHYPVLVRRSESTVHDRASVSEAKKLEGCEFKPTQDRHDTELNDLLRSADPLKHFVDNKQNKKKQFPLDLSCSV